ncbi:F-box protein [Quillaja saponaria]|uniref:F-box protein n=1 Tax=Quillaja saponaria TaxID=32244 RepID=A0AAD7L9D1_QUISA|nr:F-box protein [Quillaja saponaria]
MNSNSSKQEFFLSHDLVYGVLTWLPAKSLMRFKNVCKLWNTQIAHNNCFIECHKNRLRPGTPTFSISCQTKNLRQVSFFSVKEEEKDIVHMYTKRLEDHPLLRVSCVFDGLVCFFNRNNATICNLSTHECFTLPPPCHNYPFTDYLVSFYAIGYDPMDKLYKVLHIWEYVHGDQKFYEVITLSTTHNNTTRRKLNPPPWVLGHTMPSHNICINGTIYLACFTKVPHYQYEFQIILGFDVGDEKFQMLRLPNSLHFAKYNNIPILELDGCLAVAQLKYDHRKLKHEIKVMKLEDVENEIWVTESTIVLPYQGKPGKYFAPHFLASVHFLTLTSSGEIMLLMEVYNQGLRVLSYDRATKIFTDLDFMNELFKDVSIRKSMVRIHNYVENIMRLP